jgi:HTTM domain
VSRAWRSWSRFWFEPEPTGALGLFRICFGLLALLWTLSLLPDLHSFFSGTGVLPRRPADGSGVWDLLPGHETLLFVLLVAACVCLMLGLGTRLAAVVVFAGIVSFERRNPFVFNSGDGLIRVMALYLALAPSGAALSLDSLRRGPGRFWEQPLRAPWAWRLLQVQFSVLYVSAAWAKLRGGSWNDGTAVSYALRVADLHRFGAPHFLSHGVLASNLLTYGAVAIELALGVLVWNRRLRPWVLAAGLLLHLGIELTIRVGFFSLALFVLYLVWLPPDWPARRLPELLGRGAAAARRAAGGVAAATTSASSTASGAGRSGGG